MLYLPREEGQGLVEHAGLRFAVRWQTAAIGCCRQRQL
jgi:hypothetical protein